MKQVLFSLFFSLLFLIPCEAFATRMGFGFLISLHLAMINVFFLLKSI